MFPQNFTSGSTNNGIYVQLVPGAGSLLLDHINLSQAGGLIIDQAYNTVISGGSQFEAESAITGSAFINLRGSTGAVIGTKFVHSQVQAIGGIGTPLLLNIGANAIGTLIEGVAFATPTAYTPVTNSSTSTQCGPNIGMLALPRALREQRSRSITAGADMLRLIVSLIVAAFVTTASA
jgi:hypothetical protein